MTRQVRLSNDVADRLLEAFPGESLSAAANTAITEALRARRAGPQHVSGNVNSPAPAATPRAAQRRADTARGCLHPVRLRKGVECGLCGKPVWARGTARLQRQQ